MKDEVVQIQPRTSDIYTVLIKDLKLKNTEFHMYKLKQERSYRVVLKNMHAATNLDNLKTAIEKQGHCVVNIWNTKQKFTKKPLSTFFVNLKPNNDNKKIGYKNINAVSHNV